MFVVSFYIFFIHFSAWVEGQLGRPAQASIAWGAHLLVLFLPQNRLFEMGFLGPISRKGQGKMLVSKAKSSWGRRADRPTLKTTASGPKKRPISHTKTIMFYIGLSQIDGHYIILGGETLTLIPLSFFLIPLTPSGEAGNTPPPL